uniref:discoidin domain-containing protein n=2 Tax=Bacteroidales TaxID=171549 RepID=UPI0025915453
EIDPSIRIYELYPNRHTATVEYDDDGVTEAYRQEKSVSTLIESDVNAKKNNLTITIHPAAGNFDGFVKDKKTELRINVTEKPKKLSVKINGKNVKLTEVNTVDDFLKGENVFWYEETPNLNKFATKGSEFEKVTITKNPQVRVRLAATDITARQTTVNVEGFRFEAADRYRVTTGALTVPQNAQVTEENREAYTLKPTWDKVSNADFYEIEFGGMLYTTIRNTYLLFEGLEAETPYSFKVRAVNKDGVSDWAAIQVTTKANPLEFAIHGIEGESTAPSQGGFGVNRLFDFAESGDNWHTKYRTNAIPLDLVIDLKTVNQLDKFHYLPRTDAGNGTILKGSVSYSMDKEHWTEAGAFDWKRDGEVKVFEFANHPTARYIKLNITAGVGNYASGRELYIFKVPGTASYLQGDINNDGKIDRNDLTSYMNYTGLRRGDSDYEGYISKGDINMNDLIDAYDISVVATQLEGGIGRKDTLKVSGSLSISTPKRLYQKDEIVEIRVKGNDLKAVNALSFALPYDQNDYEFVGVESLNMKAMENLTYDRMHTSGVKSLYPTFVNLGKQESLNGSEELFILKLKAKRKVKFELTLKDGILVDKELRMHQF